MLSGYKPTFEAVTQHILATSEQKLAHHKLLQWIEKENQVLDPGYSSAVEEGNDNQEPDWALKVKRPCKQYSSASTSSKDNIMRISSKVDRLRDTLPHISRHAVETKLLSCRN